MERPRDDHKLTHNVRLATRDKLFGGTVSRLQARALLPWLPLLLGVGMAAMGARDCPYCCCRPA